MNYHQSGGYGTVSGIQLRGQPKRYATVYIDGVKVSDPSTPSNDYYFNNLISGSIDRIEVWCSKFIIWKWCIGRYGSIIFKKGEMDTTKILFLLVLLMQNLI